MPLYLDKLSWLRTNKSLFSALNDMCLAEKQQFEHVAVVPKKRYILVGNPILQQNYPVNALWLLK